MCVLDFNGSVCVVVLCIAPGNLHMAPGIRVSQLLNISFDMAAWVSLKHIPIIQGQRA
jgi:hypothetical protein